MTVSHPTDPETVPPGDPQHGLARKNRGIRFFDPEWEAVKQAAQALDLTPAEFVRDRNLEFVRNPPGDGHVAIPANLTPLIERTFRYAYMLATKMRDEMIDHGKTEELDTLVSEARALQSDLLASPTD